MVVEVVQWLKMLLLVYIGINNDFFYGLTNGQFRRSMTHWWRGDTCSIIIICPDFMIRVGSITCHRNSLVYHVLIGLSRLLYHIFLKAIFLFSLQTYLEYFWIIKKKKKNSIKLSSENIWVCKIYALYMQSIICRF